VRLSDVAVTGGAGLPRLQVEEIRATVPLTALLGRGQPPLRHLEARGVQILWPAAPPPTAAGGEKAPAAGQPAGTPPAAGAKGADSDAPPRSGKGAPVAAPSPASVPAGLLRRAIRLLADDARIQLRDVEVRGAGLADAPPLIRGLAIELRRLGPGKFHLQAATAPGAEPALSVDLGVEPDLLRAVGRLEFSGLPLRLWAALAPGLPLDPDSEGWLDGKLTLTEAGAGAVGVAGSLSLSEATVRSAALASLPVHGVGIELAGLEAQRGFPYNSIR
jgi:hypothetical protein